MSYTETLEKFSKAFDVLGHYIYESSRIVTIMEADTIAHEILRANMNKLEKEGKIIFEEANNKFGAIITEIPKIGFYIIVLEANKIAKVEPHWKRINKGLFAKLPFDSLLSKSSIENRMIALKERYLVNIDKIMAYYK